MESTDDGNFPAVEFQYTKDDFASDDRSGDEVAAWIAKVRRGEMKQKNRDGLGAGLLSGRLVRWIM